MVTLRRRILPVLLSQTPLPLRASQQAVWGGDSRTWTLRQNSDGTGAVGNGDPVGYMLDKVAGISATQGTGSLKPTWDATAHNGFGGLSFDGTDDLLTIASAASNVFNFGTGDFTLMFVIDALAGATLPYSLFYRINGAINIIFDVTTGKLRINNVDTTITPTTGKQLISVTRNSTGTQEVYRGTTLLQSTVTPAANVNTTATTTLGRILFDNSTHKGTIAAMWAFSRTFTTAELQGYVDYYAEALA